MAKSKKPADAQDQGLPMWAQLRKAYEFATPEERAKFDAMAKAVLQKGDVAGQAKCTSSDQCSGCISSDTGGCKPGTACLFTCLQSGQK